MTPQARLTKVKAANVDDEYQKEIAMQAGSSLADFVEAVNNQAQVRSGSQDIVPVNIEFDYSRTVEARTRTFLNIATELEALYTSLGLEPKRDIIASLSIELALIDVLGDPETKDSPEINFSLWDFRRLCSLCFPNGVDVVRFASPTQAWLERFPDHLKLLIAKDFDSFYAQPLKTFKFLKANAPALDTESCLRLAMPEIADDSIFAKAAELLDQSHPHLRRILIRDWSNRLMKIHLGHTSGKELSAIDPTDAIEFEKTSTQTGRLHLRLKNLIERSAQRFGIDPIDVDLAMATTFEIETYQLEDTIDSRIYLIRDLSIDLERLYTALPSVSTDDDLKNGCLRAAINLAFSDLLEVAEIEIADLGGDFNRWQLELVSMSTESPAWLFRRYVAGWLDTKTNLDKYLATLVEHGAESVLRDRLPGIEGIDTSGLDESKISTDTEYRVALYDALAKLDTATELEILKILFPEVDLKPLAKAAKKFKELPRLHQRPTIEMWAKRLIGQNSFDVSSIRTAPLVKQTKLGRKR